MVGWVDGCRALFLRPLLCRLNKMGKNQIDAQELELRAYRAKLRAYGAEIGGMKRILASATASSPLSSLRLLPTAAGEGAELSDDGGGGTEGSEEA